MIHRRGLIWLILLLSILGFAVVITSLIRFKTKQAPASIKPLVLGTHNVKIDTNNVPQIVTPLTKLNDSQPKIQAKSVYLLDVDSSYPLFAKNESEQIPIASVTKLMTAIVSRKSYQLTDIATTDEKAASIDGSKIQLRVGEKMEVKSLLTGLLIQSGNDAAMTLAEHMGLEAFIAAMNEQASYLGMKDTLFKDPAGLSDEGHSTAHDLAILASFALRDDVIRSIIQTQQATVSSIDGSTNHTLETSNRLIKTDHPLYLPEVTGMKTGFTPDAGHCLVASATKNGRSLVSVVLHTASSSNEASALETYKLLTWAFNTYSWDQNDHN
jgi:D-alanyl-D-alanine carboxypeptidase (penicillin-binding protein 5/6)